MNDQISSVRPVSDRCNLGMNDQISSVRPVSDRCNYQNVAPAPLAAPTYEYRQRANERVMKHM